MIITKYVTVPNVAQPIEVSKLKDAFLAKSRYPTTVALTSTGNATIKNKRGSNIVIFRLTTVIACQ